MQGPAEIGAVGRGCVRLHRAEMTGEHNEVTFA